MNKMIKGLLSVFLLSVLIQTGLMAQDLVPVKTNGQYGFNRNGNSVIAPQFLYATHFSEGLALVKTKTGWGYINEKGAFVIEPNYSNAEPIHDGFGKVYLNTKCGIVSHSGNVLLEPIYDSIVFGYNDNYVYLNKLMGQVSKDFSRITPIQYTKFEANRDFLSAQKNNGMWDVYQNDQLVLEDLQTPIDYDHYLFNSSLGFLKKNGKYGVYSADRGWIFEPQFDTIIRLPFQRYTIGDNYFDELFLLEKTALVPMTDLIETRFKVMTGDGNLVSNDEFSSFQQASVVIGMQQNVGATPGIFFYNESSTTLLYEDLSFRKMPYNEVKAFLNWFIVKEGNQQAILDADFKKIAAFDAVDLIVNRSASEYYDDLGNFIETETVYDYNPYLTVFKNVNGEWQSALYSLDDQKVVSPFLVNGSFQSSINGSDEMFAGYTYIDGRSDNRGIYMVGMDMGTELNYLEVNFYHNRQCVAYNPKTELNELLEVRDEKLSLLMEDYTIAPAFTLIQTYEFFDDTLGDFMLTTSQAYFENYFMIAKSIDDKLGLLCQNGVRIPSVYDSILQNPGAPQFLDVYKNGLYGAVNLTTGEVKEALSPIPMVLTYSEENKTYFAFIEVSNDEMYYIGPKGKFYSLEPLTTAKIVDVNGKQGVQVQSDFSERKIELIPPLYKKITILNDGYTPLFVAKNAEGKIGVLDVNVDTLAPFEFSGFRNDRFHNEQSILILKKGKKEAVYDYCIGELVPPVYDGWNELLDLGGSYSFIQVNSDEKLGLRSAFGQELLPCVYDCINVASADFEDMQYKTIQVQRNGKWWALPVFVPDQTSFQCNRENRSLIYLDTTRFNGPFDFIINDIGYAKQANGSYTSYWSNVSNAIKSESAPFEPVIEGALEIFAEEGKLGVRSNGKVVLKPTFTNVRFYEEDIIIVSDKGSNFYYNLISKKRYKLEQW